MMSWFSLFGFDWSDEGIAEPNILRQGLVVLVVLVCILWVGL